MADHVKYATRAPLSRYDRRLANSRNNCRQRDRYSEEVFGRDVGVGALTDTFGGRGDNFLALKMTYWIPVR